MPELVDVPDCGKCGDGSRARRGAGHLQGVDRRMRRRCGFSNGRRLIGIMSTDIKEERQRLCVGFAVKKLGNLQPSG